MNPDTNRPTLATSQLSIQNEEITFEKAVHQLSEFKGRNLIKRLKQISEENKFYYISFKSGYQKKEFRILENLLDRARFIIKEIDTDEESNILTLTIIIRNNLYWILAGLTKYKMKKNANIIIRANYEEVDNGVYRRSEHYFLCMDFVGNITNSKTKISDGAIYSSRALRRDITPPILIEVGATQDEFKLLDSASTWLNYEERGNNINSILLCNARREVRPKIEDKEAAARRPFMQTRLEYIDFAMYLREHRTALHRTRQETARALQLNYCSAVTVHVTYPAERQFHLEFIQPPHSIYNSSRSECAPAVDGIPNTISIPRKIIDPNLQFGDDDYVDILTNLDIMAICKQSVFATEDMMEGMI